MIQLFKRLIRPIYYSYRKSTMRWKENVFNIFHTRTLPDASDIPIIINNRNRLTSLKDLINFLEKAGQKNIIILDNDSTYPPLLEYYNSTSIKVHRLGFNGGHLALWKTPFYKKFINDFYVYTDSDVIPIKECPLDFMKHFREVLLKNPDVFKVGFSLKIDDLPDTFLNKGKVIAWEKQFYERPVGHEFFQASIDTTFAMYRPWMKGGASLLKMYRTNYPYQARHMPWYVESNNLSEEEQYYVLHAIGSTHWTQQQLRKL